MDSLGTCTSGLGDLSASQKIDNIGINIIENHVQSGVLRDISVR